MPTKRAVIRQPVVPDAVDSSNGDADEYEDDVPARPKMKSAPTEQLRVKRGRSEAERVMASTSSYAQAFKPDDRGCIVKILEDEPYASFRRHWIERMTKEQGKITRAYTCMKSFNGPDGKPKDCPLCEIGDKPQAVACYNIAICSEDGSLALKSWDMGAKIFNLAKTYGDNPKVGPLSKNFYFVTKTGQRQQSQTNMVPVKATALEEDYDVAVPTDAQLNALDLYTEDIVQVTSMKELRDLASELVDDYE
jgi:hypothetical protein